ncbi:hypothetical protein EON67_00005 [archaeon]|nr:MAG: hypothetical protein EON67_00005 [archaeon]
MVGSRVLCIPVRIRGYNTTPARGQRRIRRRARGGGGARAALSTAARGTNRRAAHRMAFITQLA